MVKNISISIENRTAIVVSLSARPNWTFRKARKATKWLLRFLRLKIEKKDLNATTFSPGPTLDEAWHEMILHTKIYETFCNDNNGGKCIHHVPSGECDGLKRDRRYEATLKELGPNLDLEIFPKLTIDVAEDEKKTDGKEEEEEEEEIGILAINVNELTGKKTRLTFLTDATIHDLSMKIQDKMGIPLTQQMLICRHKNYEHLEDIKLTQLPSTDINLVLNLRGC